MAVGGDRSRYEEKNFARGLTQEKGTHPLVKGNLHVFVRIGSGLLMDTLLHRDFPADLNRTCLEKRSRVVGGEPARSAGRACWY